MRKSIGVASLALSALVLVAPVRRTEDLGDPIGNYNFKVEIDGVLVGSFSSVDGLSVEQEVVEYQSGNEPLTRKLPGRTKYGDITLKRGYLANSSLNDALELFPTGGAGPTAPQNVVVTLLDGNAGVVRRWDYFQCFPQKWELASVPYGPIGTRLEERIQFACDYFVES